MGERISRITGRVKRLFAKPDKSKPTQKISASQIIRPELAVPERGKPAPKSTSLRPIQRGSLTICVLRNGTTHVCYNRVLATVKTRDPVTRRLSRKELTDGMRKTTGYYDESGVLFDESRTDW